MFKRIMKIVAMCLGIFLGVSALGVGIYALQGGFSTKEIRITKIYFGDDSSKPNEEVYTLTDVTRTINFEPLDATNKTLQVIVEDEVGVLEDAPKTVTAGEPFTLKIKKDDKGNNVGGVVTLKFHQGEKNIIRAELKLIVDVAIPDNVLYFSGNGNANDKLNTNGKTFTMAISNNEQSVYLKSELVNAFELKSGDTNLKSAKVSYTYYDLAGNEISNKSFTDEELTTDKSFDSTTNTYNYFYKIPVTPSSSGRIDITAKMHRTYEIEKEYNSYNFDNIEEVIAKRGYSDANLAEASRQLALYNEFINKYIEYFDTTDESYNFFKDKNIDDSGKISLSYSAVAESKKYVYLTCTATINVTAVNLTGITSIKDASTYKVFNKVNFATETISGINTTNILDTFKLSLTISNETVSNVDTEKANLFKTLDVQPYMYVNREVYAEDMGEGGNKTWENYSTLVPVYGFDSNSPIIEPFDESSSEIGYLILLQKDGVSSSTEYITVTPKLNSADGKNYWEVSFNVPLRENLSDVEILKALYLQFSVKGMVLETGEEIKKESYSRIYIDYTDYKFKDTDTSRLTFNTISSQMTINKELGNADGYALDTQVISINTSSSYITNYDDVQYKSIMYFVETSSNKIEGSANGKIVSSGLYEFVDMLGNYYSFGDSNLIGERIPTYDSNGNCYIQTINASLDPVKIFAVVYLSDTNGNPIDLNGKRISLNESESFTGQNKLVVVAISDISMNMAKFTIDSFVDNMNYYTKSVASQQVAGLSFDAGSFIKRNHILTYQDATGNVLQGQDLKDLQNFLRLKLLKDYEFVLYASNFELGADGLPYDEDGDSEVTYKFMYYNESGELVELTRVFKKNTRTNKQIALNNMCGIDFTKNYKLESGDNISIVTTVEEDENLNIYRIKFVIKATSTPIANDWFMLTPITSIINQPYSTTLADSQKLNYVMCEANKLQIEDINLIDVTTYNKLYAKYSRSGNSGELDFELVTYTGSAWTPSAYTITLENDNVKYEVLNNIIIDGEINFDIVDISQAIINNPEESVDSQNFKDLNTYIDYYVRNSNNTSITYKNPDRVIQLNNDLTFTNRNKDNYLYVGSNKFFIGSGNKVTIDGIDYYATLEDGLYTLTFDKGNYYPVTSNDKVVILGEEFDIYKDESNNCYIYNYVLENEKGIPCSVSYGTTLEGHSESFTVDSYINDSTNNSSLTIDSENQTATVNFIKGEQLIGYYKDDNGLYYLNSDGNYYLIGNSYYTGQRYSYGILYVKDSNGNLMKNADGTYAKADNGINSSELYSKVGVKVFVLITFNMITDDNNGYEKTITKVLTYELLQEDIQIIGVNRKDGDEEVINSATNELSITAGEPKAIYINNRSQIPTIITSALDEMYFFDHVTFSIEDGSGLRLIDPDSGSYVTSLTKSNLSSITVYASSRIASDSARIKMSYMYKGKQVYTYFYINIEPDINFTAKDTVVREENNYKITLDSNSVYTIFDTASNTADLITTYFDYLGADYNPTIKGVTLSAISNGKFCTISNGEITIGTSYGSLYNGTSIEKDRIELSITLTLNDNTTITLENKLIIEINPVYTMDTSSLSSITINDNGNIFYNYLKLYNGTDLSSLIADLSKYADVFTIYEATYNSTTKEWINLETSSMSVIITGGQIKWKEGTPTTDKTVTLRICYIEGGEENYINDISVTIKGVELYYSETGSFSIADSSTYPSDITKLEVLESSKTISVSAGESIELENYFAFYSSSSKSYYYVVAMKEGSSEILTSVGVGTYNLYYATHENGAYQIICDTGFDVTIEETN